MDAAHRPNQIVETERGHLFEHAFPVQLEFAQPLARPLECLPNRDSLVYKALYGLKDANTVFRGTLRYQVRCGGRTRVEVAIGHREAPRLLTPLADFAMPPMGRLPVLTSRAFRT